MTAIKKIVYLVDVKYRYKGGSEHSYQYSDNSPYYLDGLLTCRKQAKTLIDKLQKNQRRETGAYTGWDHNATIQSMDLVMVVDDKEKTILETFPGK